MYELRASELGRCTKASAAVLLGYTALPTPEKMEAAYERGNVHEEECAAAMRAEGWVITDEQREVIFKHWVGVTLSGHIDGITRLDTEQDVVWEAKAPAAWTKFRDAYLRNDWSDPLAHRYAWQISVYMIATGLEALVCCLDDGTVKTFGIEVPPFTLAEIEQRVGEIIGYAEGGLPGSCSQNDWPCPVAYLHETPEVEEDEAMDIWVAEYDHWSAREKFAKDAKAQVQQLLRAHLAGTDRTTAASKVTFYEAKAPVKYDMERLAREHDVDLGTYVIDGKPSQRMKITKRGSDEPEATSGD